MNQLNSSIKSALLPLLFSCVTAVNANTLETCTDYHCDAIVPVTLSTAEWSQVKQLFSNVTSADDERRRIAQAIGLLERLVGRKNGTSVDLGKNPSSVPHTGQLDCIAESTNSTVYLKHLEQNRLLKWHSVNQRVVRHRWLFATHWTAVIADRQGTQYAVDSWYRDNGQPAIVLPLDAWFRGEEKGNL